MNQLLERYAQSGRTISIDFRKEGRAFPKAYRARHLIHPYPAKLLAEIPRFFLSNSLLSKPGDIVLDPFCGTGTVLLEAAYEGRTWVGVDANPLARLITRVKLRAVNEKKLRPILASLKTTFSGNSECVVPDVVNIDHWYTPRLKAQLAQLASAISSLRQSPEKDFLQICLSVCCRQLSNADPRLSVPVKMKVDHYPEGHALRLRAVRQLAKLASADAFAHFSEIAEALLGTLSSNPPPPSLRSGLLLTDARKLCDELSSNSVHLIITSPPYLGAQKYIRASSLNLGWLGLATSTQLRPLEAQTIGREHFSRSEAQTLPTTGLKHADTLIALVAKKNPLRAKIANAYLAEMTAVLKHLHDVLTPSGYLVLIVGNNHLCGHAFPTERYLRSMAQKLGLELRLRLVDTIKSRGLMTKRNKTADIISREYVLLLQKAAYPQELQ